MLSVFFIIVNSIAGLIGQSQNQGFNIDYNLLLLLALTVFIGGQIGSRITIKIIKPLLLKRMTDTLIIFVRLKLLSNYLFKKNK